MTQDHAIPIRTNLSSPAPPTAAPVSPPEPRATPPLGPVDGGHGDGVAAPRAHGRARSRRRTWLFGLAILATVAAIGYAVRYFNYAGVHPSTDDAYVQGDTTIISGKVSGRVSRVLVRGYQHVRKDELLVALDPVDAEIAVQQAQAGLEVEQTRVSQAAAALVAQRHQTSAALA